MDKELLMKSATAVYLACEESIADSLSQQLKWAYLEITNLKSQNREYDKALERAGCKKPLALVSGNAVDLELEARMNFARSERKRIGDMSEAQAVIGGEE